MEVRGKLIITGGTANTNSLVVDNDSLVVRTDKTVGIGTNSPAGRLHVVGPGISSTDVALLVQNSSTQDLLRIDGKNVIFNETGLDVDFRIESDGDANMFRIDGGEDRLGIGANPVSYSSKLTLESNSLNGNHAYAAYIRNSRTSQTTPVYGAYIESRGANNYNNYALNISAQNAIGGAGGAERVFNNYALYISDGIIKSPSEDTHFKLGNTAESNRIHRHVYQTAQSRNYFLPTDSAYNYNGRLFTINPIIYAGSGLTNGTYSSVTLIGDNSGDNNKTANITVAGGVVTSITQVSNGTGYLAFDTLRVSGGVSAIGGTGIEPTFRTQANSVSETYTSRVQHLTYMFPPAPQSTGLNGLNNKLPSSSPNVLGDAATIVGSLITSSTGIGGGTGWVVGNAVNLVTGNHDRNNSTGIREQNALAAGGASLINFYSKGSSTYVTQNNTSDKWGFRDDITYSNPFTRSVVDASNTTPIVITVGGSPCFGDGDWVNIAQVGGNTAANGDWYVKSLTPTTFELYEDSSFTTPSVGNGAYTSGGFIYLIIHTTGDIIGFERYLNMGGTTNQRMSGDLISFNSVMNASPNGGVEFGNVIGFKFANSLNSNVSATKMIGVDIDVTNTLPSLSATTYAGLFNGGNVGIGTAAPSATLDLVGTFQYVDGNEASGYVLTSDASGNATWQAAPSFTGNTSGTCISDIYATNIYGCSPLHIEPSGLNDVYMVENGGNVGIGTTSPDETLSVIGDGSIVKGGTVKTLTLDTALYVEYKYVGNISNGILGITNGVILTNQTTNNSTDRVIGGRNVSYWQQTTAGITLSIGITDSPQMIGADNRAETLGNQGIVTSASGVKGTVGTSAGTTITDGVSYFANFSDTNAGTITNYYGYYMPDLSGYGTTRPASTNRWGIYINDDSQNYIAGNLSVGTLNTTSKFNLKATSNGDEILNLDGLPSTTIFGPHEHIVKQGETTTTGTNTATIATISLSADDKIVVKGKIIAQATNVTIGGDFMAVGKNIAGTASIVGTADTNIKHDSGGSPSFTVTTSGANIIITVTGGGDAGTAQWLCTYDYEIINDPVA